VFPGTRTFLVWLELQFQPYQQPWAYVSLVIWPYAKIQGCGFFIGKCWGHLLLGDTSRLLPSLSKGPSWSMLTDIIIFLVASKQRKIKANIFWQYFHNQFLVMQYLAMWYFSRQFFGAQYLKNLTSHLWVSNIWKIL